MGRQDSSPPTTDRSIRSSFDRRSFIGAAGAGALALSAGCLGDGGGDGGGGTITIGALYPLPGEFAAGTAMENTTRLLVDSLNQDGGLLDREVDVIVRDTQLDAATTRDRYRELVLEDEVDVTAGTYAASAAVPIFDEISEFDTIHVTGGGAQMDIPESIRNNYEEKKYWFSTTNGAMLGLSTADFFNEYYEDLGFETVGMAGEDIPGFDPVINNFLDTLDDGVDIVFQERFSSDTTDFNPILDRGEENDIDCMVAWVSQGGSALMTQWAEQQRPYHFGGGEVFSSNPARWDQTEGLVEYVWTYIGGASVGVTPNSVTEQLISDYRDMFDGNPPPHQQGYAQWDALRSWTDAVEEAGTLNEDDVIPIMEDNVTELSTGTLEYHDQNGEWPHDPVYGADRIQYPVIQWQAEGDGGRQVPLHPDKFRDGEYQDPDWL